MSNFNNMICPHCDKVGFAGRAIQAKTSRIKCSECGEWSTPDGWAKVKTKDEYRAEIKDLTAINRSLEGEMERAKSGWLNADDVTEKYKTAMRSERTRAEAAESRAERYREALEKISGGELGNYFPYNIAQAALKCE